MSDQARYSYIDNSIWKDTTAEYFTLGDLWDCYEEWGAYGVGAPITLKNDVSVVQYYAPYLSAIQIYTIKSPTALRYMNLARIILELRHRRASICLRQVGWLLLEAVDAAMQREEAIGRKVLLTRLRLKAEVEAAMQRVETEAEAARQREKQDELLFLHI
ncbi:hypothetical protein RND71_040620 [Anisodus tanguticus]|uniref:Uncharacterized protein n=1 Tax=Anisodus tanguticus TaxID=243964 RepID=A0AAE1UP37_9SOLA|nr:hypothetical protein RND71_040620 [Anisodus tanguticus]